MSKLPLRWLANAIRDPSGDQDGLDLEEEPGRIRRVGVRLRQSALSPTVSIHLEQGVVAVPRADEGEVGSRLVVAAAPGGERRDGDGSDDRQECERSRHGRKD